MVSGIGAYFSPSPLQPVQRSNEVPRHVDGLGAAAAAKIALFNAPKVTSVISLAQLPGNTIRQKLDWLKKHRKGTSGLGAIDFSKPSTQAIALIAICLVGYYIAGRDK